MDYNSYHECNIPKMFATQKKLFAQKDYRYRFSSFSNFSRVKWLSRNENRVIHCLTVYFQLHDWLRQSVLLHQRVRSARTLVFTIIRSPPPFLTNYSLKCFFYNIILFVKCYQHNSTHAFEHFILVAEAIVQRILYSFTVGE